MLRNYFVLAYRNFTRNKTFSLINIEGLAFGLTCVAFVLLWMNDEWSWDRFVHLIDRSFRVYLNGPGDNGIYTQTVTPLAWWLMNRWLQGFAFRITIQWWMILGAGLFTLCITCLIVSLLALKIANLSPSESLRSE